ncbi:cyclin-dependent kinase inhibitor 1B [Austrofundulus limnaeus]|uniref:Cyclin-dependent kinase inhibitor 1B n=1 Tax=Austrofundulus limnaeus TaxID=52670 RepID=A0A2I4C5Q1_AUSLI|nr:PREDICTED: cyclin-dependent kinase inhibitor 1B-like [Austrofundulus limnaeus]
MSDVRLSNASPTVERVDARQPAESVRSGARRMLFGKPDREEIRRYADASQRESVRDFRERFNFDPVTETPLPGGDYEWKADEEAPEFYSRLPHGSERPPRGEARDSPGRGEESRTRTESAPETKGSRKRRSGASGSCSDECPKRRSKSDRDDDDDEEEEEDCVGGVVKTSSRPEDNQEVL